jgi:hypothetical protein
MATGKLIGSDDTAVDISAAANYIVMWKFTALVTGLCSEIKVKCGGSGNVKAGIYADSGGSPASLLAVNNSGQACLAGWNTITLSSPCLLTEGVDYHLAGISDAQIIGCDNVGSGAYYKYKASPYASGLPNPAGSGYSDSSVYRGIIAGWGVLVVSPSSTVQPISYGTPTVEVGAGGLTIIPTSIVQAIACGTPSLIYPQTIAPSSLVQAIVIGIPAVIGGETGELRIFPTSIVQQISIGSPTILKYVWHVILDGQYHIESPEINRAYVIGRDQYGNPVYGTAVDSTELGLVGERLDFQQELAIPTSSQAESMASAILSKMRLTGKKGVILIPPNCGQELFDVVEVTDSKGNQQAVKFRVVGIRFEYNPKQARYQQKLILGAP